MTSSFSSQLPPSFPARDVGLGTAYERRAISRRILRWYQRGPPKHAAEGPLDGMAGLSGLHLLPLARHGVRVTVVLPSREALARVRTVYRRAALEDRLETIESSELPSDRRFDWVLSFNALPLAADWRALLTSLSLRAERLLLFVTHPFSYGTFMRRVIRLATPEQRPELFDHAATRRRRLEPTLSALGRIDDRAWVDCPWWPDLFVNAGDTLAGALGGRFGFGSHAKFVYDADSFPHELEPLPPDLASSLRRHPHFESSRFAPIFAHHRAYLVTPNRDRQ